MSKTLQTILKGIKFFFIVPSTVSLLYLTGYQIWLKSSDAYAVTKAYVQANAALRKETGGIKGFGFFVSGLIDDLRNDEANLIFTVRGHQKNMLLHAHLRLRNEQWKVVKIEKE